VRLLRTVDSILNISQFEAGAVDVNPQSLNIVKLATQIVEELKPLANEKKISLELESENQEEWFVADEYCVNQTILNLVENAIKYTFEGGVKLKFENEDRQVTLSVIDTGIGISMDYLDRIFEPYSQESEGFSKEYQGIGLGMALTKRYLDLTGINIVIESKKGTGSTFKLIFPRD
jgi:signal transduction histidine kinase